MKQYPQRPPFVKVQKRNPMGCLATIFLVSLIFLGIIAEGASFKEPGDPFPSDLLLFYGSGVILVLISLFLIVSGIIERRKSHRWSSTLIKLPLGVLLLILSIPRFVSVVTYATGCPDRIGPGAMLKSCDFRGKDLNHMNLSGANLADARLSGANLQQANLTSATLINADLRGANLTDAILDGTTLDGAELPGAIGISDGMLARLLNATPDTLATTLTQRVIRLEAREDILNGLKDACRGIGVAKATAYTPDKTFHPLVLLNANLISEKWEPMALRFSQLVGCGGEQQRIALETCEYTGGPPITRYQYRISIRLVSASAGAVVVERSFSGAPPAQCPKQAPVSQTELVGGEVNLREIQPEVQAWLANFVNPP